VLALEDGTVFRGISIGSSGVTTGEVVFNTAMTGYQEILTDPSYARQIVTLTYPHVGNTGVTPEDLESDSIHAAGLVIRDLPLLHSSWRASHSREQFLVEGETVAIAGIDTRKLTRILRERGAQGGCIATADKADAEVALRAARAFPGLKGMDLAKVVSVKTAYQWNEGSIGREQARVLRPGSRLHVVAYDFGIKRNILRLLADYGCRITVVPAQTSAADVLALTGRHLRNGPGDRSLATMPLRRSRNSSRPTSPYSARPAINPGAASGARTVKMKFGHHGANHPVQELAGGHVLITSQNHGFAVDEDSLPQSLKPTHRSLFDGTLQGIARTDRPAFGFQGHPEASPGPHDLRPLFEHFVFLMVRRLQQLMRSQVAVVEGAAAR
jgi:carbamoyl-phosphate synthase small subunit